MTHAQQEALERIAAAPGPVSVPSVTARILHERYGYIEPRGDGWVLSDRGRASRNAEAAQERYREVKRNLTPEAQRWADRVVAWLSALTRIEGHQYDAIPAYARHVAACDHDAVEPVAVDQWAEGAREWVEGEVREAAQCLRDFDEAASLAAARDVTLRVAFEADEKVPRSRRTAIEAASRDDNVLTLRTYRERRPTPTQDGAA